MADSLCNICRKNCSFNLKTEFAMRRNLTYIYLNNGNKIINSCNQYTEGTIQRNINKPVPPQLEVPNITHPPRLNFNGNLNPSDFSSLAAKL